MNNITEIANIMSSDDISAFYKHLNSKNKRKDTLNTALFKMLKTDDIKLAENLYGSKKRQLTTPLGNGFMTALLNLWRTAVLKTIQTKNTK